MAGSATRGAPVELRDGNGVETGTVANPLDVNIASGGATASEFVRDTASGAADPGPVPMAVFSPFGNAALVGTDGDYTPLQTDGDGSLKVVVTGTVAAAGTPSTRPLGYYYDEGTWIALPPDSEAQIAITEFYATQTNLRRAVDGVEVGTLAAPLHVNIASGGSTSGALVARSGTITTGGVAQVLAAANATRKFLMIQNLSTGDLWYNFAITAVASQPSKLLEPFASVEMSGPFVSNQAISIFGATTGQAWAADEGSS